MDIHSAARAAARSNAEWCDIFCRTHRVMGEFSPTVWTSTTRTPTYYPDAVTLEVGASPSAILSRVDVSTPGCSIKDSFAALDLSYAGFEVLFEAEWIYRSGAQKRPVESDDLRWTRVRTAGELGQWEVAWGQRPTPGPLFLPELLAPENVAVLAGYDGDAIAAGAVAHRWGSVVGISNVFNRVGDLGTGWAGCVATAMRLFAGCSLAGYESGAALEAAQHQGFASVGPLRVWMHTG